MLTVLYTTHNKSINNNLININKLIDTNNKQLEFINDLNKKINQIITQFNIVNIDKIDNNINYEFIKFKNDSDNSDIFNKIENIKFDIANNLF